MAVICTKQVGYVELEGQAVFQEAFVNRQIGIEHRLENIVILFISFGDIGKALAVVVMVLQIAGSGGTYPIEALPAFFRAVYIFFPFPYAINAMRECIGGMYENTLGKCYITLLLFGAASLVIGLVIRKPFIRLNHFIEKRMEDTEML